MGGKLYNLLGVNLPFDSQHKLVTSRVFSPIFLASIRLSLAFYTLFTSIFILVWEIVVTHDAKSYFSYFTDLTYIGLCAYFWATGIHTLLYARRNMKSYPLQHWPRFLQFLHLLLFSTVTTFPLLVTAVYWSLLAGSSTFATPYSSWTNISRHLLNSVFVLFEVIFTNVGPAPWIHLLLVVAIGESYLGVAYITNKTQGFYTYNFLNPQKQHAFLAVYIIGIMLAACVIFVLIRLLCMLRERLLTSNRKQEKVLPPEAIDDWEKVERPGSPSAV